VFLIAFSSFSWAAACWKELGALWERFGERLFQWFFLSCRLEFSGIKDEYLYTNLLVNGIAM
jgi:hypothetical protein